MGATAARRAHTARKPARHTGPERLSLLLVLLPLPLALLVLPGSDDGIDDVRLLVTTAAVGLVGWRTVSRAGRPPAPRPIGAAAVTALGAFLVIASLTTFAADAPVQALIGAPGRHNGLLTYATLSVLLVLVATVVPLPRLADMARVLAAGAIAAVGYWLLQLAGLDPLGLRPPAGLYSGADVFASTLGNPNFAGAFVAAALPAALWAALRARRDTYHRRLWLAGAALLLVAVVQSDALQALVAAGAGSAVLLVALLASRSRRAAITALLCGAAVVALIGAGLAQAGPLRRLSAEDTFVYRTWDWTAAVRIVQDDPLTGVGPGRFRAYVRTYRPAAPVRALGGIAYSDTPHSVPLDMAASGGVPLFAAYLGLVGLTGWRLVTGLLRLQGERLLLLGAFGGVWAAYQAQSIVSVDMARLAALHFLSAGAIFALTARGHAAAPPRQVADRAHPAVRAMTAAVALALTLLTAGQVGAEFFTAQSKRVEQRDDALSVRYATVAVTLFPWQPVYWFQLARANEPWRDEAALRAYLRAVRLDPREMFFQLAAGNVAARLGQGELALALTREAVRLEPRAPEVKVAAAKVAWQFGRRAEALTLLDAALAFDPGHEAARTLRDELTATLRRASRGRRHAT